MAAAPAEALRCSASSDGSRSVSFPFCVPTSQVSRTTGISKPREAAQQNRATCSCLSATLNRVSKDQVPLWVPEAPLEEARAEGAQDQIQLQSSDRSTTKPPKSISGESDYLPTSEEAQQKTSSRTSNRVLLAVSISAVGIVTATSCDQSLAQFGARLGQDRVCKQQLDFAEPSRTMPDREGTATPTSKQDGQRIEGTG